MDADQQQFNRQPYDAKASVMGAVLYEAHRVGAVTWQDRILTDPQRQFYEQEAQKTTARRLLEPEWFEARDVLDRVVSILQDLLGRPSRWTGEVEIGESLFHAGVAHLDGRIGITFDVWRDPAYRWRTLLHEALHTFSPPYTRAQYRTAIGWEEGVVEQAQRLLRTPVFGIIEVPLPEEEIRRIEGEHPYSHYISVLEDLRRLLPVPQAEFYLTLLQVPLTDRLSELQRRGNALPIPARQQFRFALMLAQAQLARPIHGS